jgi:iron(III) transport system substrate-binding protein
MKLRITAVILVLAALVAMPALAQTSKSLVVYCPHPLDFINPLVQEFEVQTGIKVEVVAAGTGELLKRVEAEAANPLGDVMWGGSRSALDSVKKYFEPYTSVNEKTFIKEYIDPTRADTPFTVIPTVFMYNKNLVKANELPKSWEDMLNPKWKGKIAFADPARSSSSFEALINMLYAMGKGKPDNGWDYVGKLIRNLDGKILSGSSAVYKGVADGEYAVGITFEEAAAKYIRQGAPVGIIYPAEGTVIESDGTAIIKGAKNLANAKTFIDFLTSKNTQSKIARDLDRRSSRTDVAPALGLADLKSIKVIPGDFKWSSANKDKILAKFKDLVTE